MKKAFITRPGADIRILNEPIPEPKAGQVRVKMISAGVSQPDIMMCNKAYPAGQASFPFVPGYDGVGRIDAVGKGVKTLKVGDKVAISSKIGCWSEYACFPEKQTLDVVVVKIDEDIDSAKACTLILNYITAYQMLHRISTFPAGSRILIHGVSGGVGTALAELGILANLEVYGTCSGSKMEQLNQQFGSKVTLIDYKTQDFVEVVRKLPAPSGVDAVFDAIGASNFTRSYHCLRNKGTFITYGLQAAKSSSLVHLLPAYFPSLKSQYGHPFFICPKPLCTKSTVFVLIILIGSNKI